MENARFGRFHFQFLRKSRGKRSFWKAVLGAAASGRKNGACANLRSLAVPLGGCANACVSFFLARCARGGCKRSQTEPALIYVLALCRWAVARTLA